MARFWERGGEWRKEGGKRGGREKRKKTKKRRLSRQQRGAGGCFLTWQDLVLGFSHDLPKADDRGTSLLARFNGVGCLPTYKVYVVTQGLYHLERDGGATKPKKYRKVLTCKENQTNEDLRDSSKSVLSPKPKFSAMFYTEPRRNRNGPDAKAPPTLWVF